MSDLTMFLTHLKQPEYIHVLVNPMPVYGMAMGILALLAGLLTKSRAASMAALLVVIVAAGSILPTTMTGERAYDRVYAMSNQDAQRWLDEHEERAELVALVYYAAAALAAAALLAQWRSWKVARAMSIIAFVVSLAALAGGGWASQAGGQVRHSEFRDGPPPSSGGEKEQERGR